jgi:hypothetical protein
LSARDESLIKRQVDSRQPTTAMSDNSGPLATPTRTNLSHSFSSSSQLFGLLAASGTKDYRLNADYNADSDHAKITMKTCVAVRDKTPHRFQVVPLRDVRKLAPLEGGRLSQLALPPASHTLLRSASIRRQTYSQVRPVIASSPSQLDINTQDKCDMTMQADSETLATPRAEMLAIPRFALSPSFKLDNVAESHPLSEQDMNRLQTKTTTYRYESAVATTPTKAPQIYDANYHTHVQNPVVLFSDRSPSLHTTSQSLNFTSCNSGIYPKISRRNTPEHLFEPIQSSIMESKSSRKKRTRSENIPRIRDNNQRDGRNGLAAKDSCDSRMTKRHAIYTQSLCVPFLELPSYFPGSSVEERHQLFGVPNENLSDSHPDEASFNEMSQAFVSESGTTLSNTNSDQINPTPGQDPIVEATPSLQVVILNPSGSSATAPHNGRYRGLKYHRLSRVYPLSAEARLHIVYPRIVREMFMDIDRAIHEWKNI